MSCLSHNMSLKKTKTTLFFLLHSIVLVTLMFLNGYLTKQQLLYLGAAYRSYVFLFGGIRAFSLLLFGFLLPYRKIEQLIFSRFRAKLDMKKVLFSCILPVLIVLIIWLPILLSIFCEFPTDFLFHSLVVLTDYPLVMPLCWIMIGFNIASCLEAKH